MVEGMIMKRALLIIVMSAIFCSSASCVNLKKTPDEYRAAHSVVFNGETTFLESITFENDRVVFPFIGLLFILGFEYADSDLNAYGRSVIAYNDKRYVIDTENRFFMFEDQLERLMEISGDGGDDKISFSAFANSDDNLLSLSLYESQDPGCIVEWLPGPWVDHITLQSLFESIGYSFLIDYNTEAQSGPIYVSFQPDQ